MHVYTYIYTHTKKFSATLQIQLLIPVYLEAVYIFSTNNAKNLPCSRASVFLIYALG